MTPHAGAGREQRPLVALAALALALAAGAAGAATAGDPAPELFGVPAILKIAPAALPAPGWSSGLAAVECARNEWEAVQIVARSPGPLADLAFTVSDLRGPGGALLPAARMRLRRVAWVDVNAPVELDRPAQDPDLRPDPLVPLDPAADRFSLEPGRNLVLWVIVHVPESAAAGLYEGQATLSAPGGPVATLTVSLRVRDFALPPRPLLQSMVGLVPENLYKAHGSRTPQEKEAVVRLYLEEYIRARLSPFLYADGTIAFNPLPGGRIGWEFGKRPDGTLTGAATLDFAGFDREAKNYLDRRQAFSAFNVAPFLWVRRQRDGKAEYALRIADSAGAAVERLNPDGTVNPLFDVLTVEVFRQIAGHLQANGWLDRALYYVADEPAAAAVPAIRQICRLIRQADPRLRTALTFDPAHQPRLAELADDAGRSLVSIWIPYCSAYREDVAARERAKGAEYWLYDIRDTCLITHTGLANRTLIWTVWRRDARGLLYYLSDYWGREATPWERPNFTIPGVDYTYREGDGYFFYPPRRAYDPQPPVADAAVTSIRWELLREGAEDYDTLRLLEGLTTRAEQRGLPAAKTGRDALAAARALAELADGSVSVAAVADLDVVPRGETAGSIRETGWSFNTAQGWLRHSGGGRTDLPVGFAARVPDGRYELILKVYSDDDYFGRPYSRFLVDGRERATGAAAHKGVEEVAAGEVEVKDGTCRFTLSSVAGDAGVVVYRVGLRRVPGNAAAELPRVRSGLADAVEQLQAALGPGP